MIEERQRTPCPISVAVATYNREGFLRKNLPRVLEQLGEDDELLVLDNNSIDGTARYVAGLADPRVRYLRVERQGLNNCRNVALDAARHGNIAFLDDDAYPGPAWMTAFRRAREQRPAAAILAGRTELEFEACPPSYLPEKHRYLLGALDYGRVARPLRRHESPGGGNMLIDRERLLGVCRFDERFDRNQTSLLSNGETDVAWALHDAGGEIYYFPDAVIYHWAGLERTRWRWLLTRMYFQGVSDGRLAAKRGRFLHYCLRRVAFHCLKAPVESAPRIRTPSALLFGALLEVAKTAGAFGAMRYGN